MYSEWDISVREVGGGIWFWMSAALTFAFVAYVFRRVVLGHARPDAVIVTAVALAIFSQGSAVRGFLTWMQFLYAGRGWDPSAWIATWPWFGMSVILNIVGAAFCIWLLAPQRGRALITVTTVGVALAIPIGVFLFL